MTENNVRRDWLMAGLLAAAAAAWRLPELGAESLWTDEIAAILVCRRGLLETLGTIGVQDVNPPLFYLLLHGWLWGGEAEWWVRLLPALFGVAAVPLAWRLGRRLGGEAVGVTAALLLAFSPVAVYLSREVRYHTLVAFLALAAFDAAWRLFETGGREGRRALTLSLALGFYTHYYFLFVPAIVLAWRAVERRAFAVPWRAVVRPIALALAAFAPWLLVVALQAARASYRFRPAIGPLDLLLDFAGYATVGHADARLPLVANGLTPAALVAVLLPFWVSAGLGLAAWRTQRAARAAAIGLFLPLAAVTAASRFAPVYGHRYFLPFLPFFFLLLGVGLERTWRRSRLLAAALLLAICGAMTGSDALQRLDAQYQREDWRGLAARLRQLAGAGDALLAYNESQVGPLAFYWRRQTGADPDYRALLPGSPLVFAEHSAAEVAGRVALYRGQAERLWLLDHFAHMYDPPGHARAALDRMCLREPNDDLTAAHRIPVRVYWRDRDTANRRVGPRYAARLDFGAGGFERLQLGSGWSHVDDEWAWMSPEAEIYLRAADDASAIGLRAWHLPRCHDGAPLTLTVAIDEAPPTAIDLPDDQPRTVELPLPSAAARGAIVRVALHASRSFDPAAQFGGADHSPKSLLVDWLELR